MARDDRPQLIVIAGPNGAGKSTLTAEAYPELIRNTVFINPDEIITGVALAHPDKTTTQQQIIAARQALNAYDACFSERKSFSLETTLAGNVPLKTLQKAWEQGYQITLAYVGIESPLDSVARVRERVLLGGHDIPVEDIFRRYERSLHNLPAAMALADTTLLFDNSQSKHTLHLFLKNNVVKEVYQEQHPNWLKERVLESSLQKDQPFTFQAWFLQEAARVTPG